MHIWTIESWKKIYKGTDIKPGLRLHFDIGMDDEIKRATKQFAAWLRTEYFFPVRVNIYFKNKKFIKALDGELVSAVMLLPQDRMDYPYSRIAVGDYYESLKECGKDNTLASYLASMVHELTHYFQWINDIELTEIGMERQAKAYVDYILDEYAETREHP